VLAGGHRHDPPPRAPTPDPLGDLGPLPEEITVPLGCGDDWGKTRDTPTGRRPQGEIAGRGGQAPIRASRRWRGERANAWHHGFDRLQRRYERRRAVVEAFFDLADTIITLGSLIRRAWTTHRWDTRPTRRP
jgi:hypothetical protein